MLKPRPFLLSLTVLWIASLACVVPSVNVSTPNEDTQGTMIAQTIAVAVTRTAQAFIPGTDTAIPTRMFEIPTASPTATSSPIPVVLFTATPAVPLISVSQATNCRTGPGRTYDRVGGLLVDQVAEVIGRNAAGDYWYIRNPNQPGGFCWLWGEYATLTGNTSVLPIFTPPPTPTIAPTATPAPAFTVTYQGLETCSSSWWVELKLENTGGVTFRSVSITLRDTVTDTVLSLFTDDFTNKNGCTDSVTRDILRPGGTRIVSLPAFSYNPTGHQLRATIILCSKKGVSGTCVSEKITFKP